MNIKPDYARSIGAIIGGYFVMMLVGIVPKIIAQKLLLAPAPSGASVAAPTTYLIAMIVLFALTGVVGGYLTAFISGAYPLAHASVLAVLVLLIGIAAAVFAPRFVPDAPVPPSWYSWIINIFMPLGILAGGWLRTQKQSPA